MVNDSLIVGSWKLVRRFRLGTIAGLLLVMDACASFGHAHFTLPSNAPEIDPGVMASAVTLLTGGLFVLSDRLRKK